MARRNQIAIACALFVACTGDPDDPGEDGGTEASSDSGGSQSGGSQSSGSDSSPGSSSSDGSTDSDTMDPSGADGSTTDRPSGCESGPLPEPIPGCAPVPPPSTGDPHQDCVDRINQFRWECQCLPPLARWTEAESCTNQQSADDQAISGAHAHFGACGESAQNTCPNWGSIDDVIEGCLQAMWDEGPGEPFSQHGHYINMSSTDYTKVACGFSASNAGVWSNQNFSP